MFIKQHTFLGIKSEITLLFIYFSYITLNLLLAEGLLIWTQTLFFVLFWTAWWLVKAKSPKNDTRFVSNLLCYIALRGYGALSKLFHSVLARRPKKFRFFGAAFWMDWLEETRNQNTTDSSISFFDMSPTRINRALLKLFPSVLGSRPKAFVFV